MDELDLTDAQKQRIAELRQSLTDRRERREAVLNVLTPEQRTRLKELRGESPSLNLTSKLPAANGT
jgi:Spy/CpxP family protein refolding chaperone